MRKRRAQTAAARQASLDFKKERERSSLNLQENTKVSANSMIYARLMNGSNVEKLAMTLDCCDIDHESILKTKYLLGETEERSIVAANESCQRARSIFLDFYQQILDGAAVKIDRRPQQY